MIQTWFLSVLVVMLAAAPARTPSWGFRWQPGQALTYRVEQHTSVTDVAGGNKVETTTRMQSVKCWQVLEVDAEGAATLRLALLALRIETTTPKGEVLLFDSENPDKSNPHMREQLARFVTQPLAVIRVGSRGRVLEVMETHHAPASRFENELPFILMLPDQDPRAGLSWERSYQVTLAPPQGTGEKYDAAQRYVCSSLAPGAATIELTTILKTMPESPADRIPLLQFLPQGEAVFDTQLGCMRSARLRIDQELKGHQGEGSSYRIQSSYSEELQERK